MKQLVAVAAVLLFASVAMGQTNTPTHTHTPTITPTFTDQNRLFKAEDGTIFRTGTAGALSAWTQMPNDPVFEFELISGSVVWKLWCRQENAHPFSGKQMAFDNGATTVTADAVLTLAGNPAPDATPPAATADRTFARWCQLEIDDCTDCDGVVRFSGRSEQ